MQQRVQSRHDHAFCKMAANNQSFANSVSVKPSHRHNAAHHWVETEIVTAMIASSHNQELDLEATRDSLRDLKEFQAVVTASQTRKFAIKGQSDSFFNI